MADTYKGFNAEKQFIDYEIQLPHDAEKKTGSERGSDLSKFT